MFLSLCGVAVACAVTGHPAEAVKPTTALPSPPRVVEVQEQVFVKPRRRAARRNPPVYLYRYSDQDRGCEAYNCVGPRTTFRLPNEVPYADYEQQYARLPPGG